MLRIYERNKDSLRSVFMGKESAKRILTYVEDLLSLSPLEQFARTFREGNKVFILQLGFNVHGSFLMISELVHGHRKGLIIVLEESWVVGGEDLASTFVRLFLPNLLSPNHNPLLS